MFQYSSFVKKLVDQCEMATLKRAVQIQDRSRHGLGKLTYSGDNCWCQLSKFWFLLPTTKIFEIGSLTCITRRLDWLRHDVHVLCVLLWIELQILIFQEDCLECAAHWSFMSVSVFPNPYFWDNWHLRKTQGVSNHPNQQSLQVQNYGPSLFCFEPEGGVPK